MKQSTSLLKEKEKSVIVVDKSDFKNCSFVIDYADFMDDKRRVSQNYELSHFNY